MPYVSVKIALCLEMKGNEFVDSTEFSFLLGTSRKRTENSVAAKKLPVEVSAQSIVLSYLDRAFVQLNVHTNVFGRRR